MMNLQQFKKLTPDQQTEVLNNMGTEERNKLKSKIKQAQRRQAMNDILSSLNMTKVKGAVSGQLYYE